MKGKLREPLQLTPFATYFTPAQVKNAINTTPTRKAPGYDKIVLSLFKRLISLLSIFF